MRASTCAQVHTLRRDLTGELNRGNDERAELCVFSRFCSSSLNPLPYISTLHFPINESPFLKHSSCAAKTDVFPGFTGLYRGIGSNIASSAPISAVYTFTYESVREALLPFLPKEYYSFTHCTAGGCASIDTSFIFTPSERIKQQMQIGSRYQNCWNALTGIIEKGGLPSIYAGWGAVLCGNIPHAIIKLMEQEPSPEVFVLVLAVTFTIVIKGAPVYVYVLEIAGRTRTRSEAGVSAMMMITRVL